MIRLRSASVLVIGMRGLGAEVCKNLVLAGIRELTVLDPNALGAEDVAGRFLTQTEGENVRQRVVHFLHEPKGLSLHSPFGHVCILTHSCELAPRGQLSL